MQEKIIEIIRQVKEDNENRLVIDSNTNIIEEIKLDSTEMINFVLELEEAFDIEIDFDEFDYSYLESVQSLCQYIETLIG